VIEVFADSFYFLALFNPSDAAHDAAVMASKELPGLIATTDWVLTEVADALSDPKNREDCVRFLDDVRTASRIIVEPASRSLFEDGWELYGSRGDKGWSLTDCISFVVMRDRKIGEALTGDHHFEQAGFRALLK
jgi:uncharacterized protein